MQKSIKKIICLTVCSAMAASVALTAGCSYYGAKALPEVNGDPIFVTEAAQSNGGFAVKKGAYIYFVNGTEVNTAINDYGTPVKGALMRIHEDDFASRNYAKCDVVVPQIIYSGNTNAGIYVYGDYVYYATPSTAKNSDGEVQNTLLEFKSAKLDGTQAMQGYYYQATDNTVDYRYVEVDGTVYLLYAASEDLYETGSSVTNIHSVNTQTGEDVLLAYNVTSFIFDENVENANVYYTMSVNRYIGSSNSSAESYNQVYRVSADVTESDREYDFSYVEEDRESDAPVYLNMGEFVFDGIGATNLLSQFNYEYHDGVDGENTVSNHAPYTYTLSAYKDGTLYYSRKSANDSKSFLFSVSDEQCGVEGWNAVTNNPSYTDCLLMDASAVGSYEFVTVDDELKVISITNNDIIMNSIKDGNLVAEFAIAAETSTPTILFTQAHDNLGHSYLYYSTTGGAGYTVNRVAYDGEKSDYTVYPTEENLEYKYINVLNVDAVSTWYVPEIIDNQLIYASEVGVMDNYNYVEVCNLNGANGMMSNDEIEALNTKYTDLLKAIAEADEEVYKGISAVLNHSFYVGDDTDYIQELRQAYVDIKDSDIDAYYTEATIAEVKDFLAVEGNWADYATDSVTVNGKTVYANSHDYYYAQLGFMAEADVEAYVESSRASNLQAYPEDTSTWWEGLETWAKVLFIVGVSLGGLLVLGAIAVLVIFLIKKNNTKRPVYKKAKRKIDTTDDKSIDVYSDEE
ncbi:MAG: hypothetical protein E7370_03220 [Clostridiales bacterium]|nr:hypothetical protein [Clostridiales bacterium]